MTDCFEIHHLFCFEIHHLFWNPLLKVLVQTNPDGPIHVCTHWQTPKLSCDNSCLIHCKLAIKMLVTSIFSFAYNILTAIYGLDCLRRVEDGLNQFYSHCQMSEELFSIYLVSFHLHLNMDTENNKTWYFVNNYEKTFKKIWSMWLLTLSQTTNFRLF